MTDWRDLAAIETVLSGRIASVRRHKARLKAEAVAAGDLERMVTDHAVLRYLERHRGIDIEAVRNELRRIANEALQAKDSEHHWHEESGVLLIIGDEGQVITVLAPEHVEKWTSRLPTKA